MSIAHTLAVGAVLFINFAQQDLGQFADDGAGTTSSNSTPSQLGEDPTRDSSERSKVHENEKECQPGVIYARVSSNKQAEEGRSIEAQIDDMRAKAEEFDIDLICEPITDEGETGTDFKRTGIKKVFHLAAKGEISYVLVDDISRIGRNAPQTLYYIYTLREDCQVKIITHTGLQNVSQVEDLIETTMQALIAHTSAQNRSRSSIRSRIRGFIDEQNWSSWSPHIPLGYAPTDDGWITRDPEEVEVVTTMFNRFLETESYTKTANILNDEYGEILDEPIDYRQVKRNLQRRVYIGKPTADPDAETEDRRVIEEQKLSLIDQETFETAQSLITEIGSRNTSSNETLAPETVIDEFGLIAFLNSSPIAKLICEDCGGEFRCNGQRELDGSYVAHNLECKQCGVQRKYPYLVELEKMKKLSAKGDD
jgi:DNA invertase Pin-like site-specific DNA recombinase